MSQKHSAFSLIGTLIAILLLMSFAAYFACNIAKSSNPRLQIERDSRELKSWLCERMAFADASSSVFSVTALADTGNSKKLLLVWTSGPLYAHSEYFVPDNCTLYSSRSGEAVYSGQWHTMTPAVTYTVSCKTASGNASQKITVSGQGYVH